MVRSSVFKSTLALVVVSALGACGGLNFGPPNDNDPNLGLSPTNPNYVETNPDNTIWAIFNRKDNDTSVSVTNTCGPRRSKFSTSCQCNPSTPIPV